MTDRHNSVMYAAKTRGFVTMKTSNEVLKSTCDSGCRNNRKLEKKSCFLSIIIPVYNSEEYLRECLDSCLNQDLAYDDYEIICINDGSSDGSLSILKEYEKECSNLNVVSLERNRGVSVARNVGIEQAVGEYIWFVDSDDCIAYNVLQDLKDQIRKSKPDVLYVKPLRVQNDDDSERLKNGYGIENESTLFYHDWLWTRIIKRQVVMISGLKFDPKVKYTEDNLFCIMLNKHIRVEDRYKNLVYFYRNTPHSLANTPSEDKLFNMIKSAEVYLHYCEQGVIDKKLAYRSICEIMNSVLCYVSRLPGKQEKKFISFLKSKKLFPIKSQTVGFGEEYYDNCVAKTKYDKIRSKAFTKLGYIRLKRYRINKRICIRVKSFFNTD